MYIKLKVVIKKFSVFVEWITVASAVKFYQNYELL